MTAVLSAYLIHKLYFNFPVFPVFFLDLPEYIRVFCQMVDVLSNYPGAVSEGFFAPFSMHCLFEFSGVEVSELVGALKFQMEGWDDEIYVSCICRALCLFHFFPGHMQSVKNLSDGTYGCGKVAEIRIEFSICLLYTSVNGLMALPNLISLWIFAAVVVKLTESYFGKGKKNQV